MRTVDLTLTMEDGEPAYPGDPETEIRNVATVDEDGYATKRLSFSSHVGTHVDAPAHMLRDGKTVDEYAVDRFVGEAVVVDVHEYNPIGPETVRDAGDADMVFLRTGHVERSYGDDGYYDNHPIVAEEAAEKLVDRGVRTVGLDAPSPDEPPYPVHDILLGNDVLLLENLTNLGAVGDGPFICYALPLNIADADGAPCRVIGVVD
ncbi:MAG: cyclase family protein [Halobacteriales archaeon]